MLGANSGIERRCIMPRSVSTPETNALALAQCDCLWAVPSSSLWHTHTLTRSPMLGFRVSHTACWRVFVATTCLLASVYPVGATGSNGRTVCRVGRNAVLTCTGFVNATSFTLATQLSAPLNSGWLPQLPFDDSRLGTLNLSSSGLSSLAPYMFEVCHPARDVSFAGTWHRLAHRAPRRTSLLIPST